MKNLTKFVASAIKSDKVISPANVRKKIHLSYLTSCHKENCLGDPIVQYDLFIPVNNASSFDNGIVAFSSVYITPILSNANIEIMIKPAE